MMDFTMWKEDVSEETDYEMSGQALPVAPFDINDVDENSIPLTSQEYLQQVIAQRVKLPAVLTATVPKLKTTDSRKSDLCYIPNEDVNKSEYSPSKEWQREQIYNFSKLRSYITNQKETWPIKNAKRLPRDKTEWCKFLFRGNPRTCNVVEQQPYLDAVLRMNNETMENVIKFIVEWIIEDQLSVYVAGTWLFALLACIEVPVSVNVIRKLRLLVHECRKLRDTLDLSNEDSKRELAAQNLIICLVGKYFGQHDLSD